MKKWIAEWGAYTFTITEIAEDRYDLGVDHFYANDLGLWFYSYKSARDFLRKEYGFIGRMKRSV